MSNTFEGAEAGQATRPCPFCGESILATAIKCKHCGEMFGTPASMVGSGNADAVYAEYQALKASRKRNNLFSFACGIPALLLTFGGQVGMSAARDSLSGPPDGAMMIAMLAMPIAGIALWACAFVFAAKYKGRNGLWGLAALIGCFGLLIIALLKDLNNERLLELKAMLKLMGRHIT